MDDDVVDGHGQLLLKALERLGVEVAELGRDSWAAVLPGERKRALPVRFDLDERSLKVTAHLTRALDEGHAEVYELLLRRNLRHGPVHFSLDDDGDVVLVGSTPRALLDDDAIDGLLGALVTEADETFERILRVGFRGYIDHEQRWRDKLGLPENPIDRGRRTRGEWRRTSDRDR